ncbi:MipA/OmpV family protein [Tateyamaria omphalii]|nr:MipA/OmpV family protein [Tateyamaria omphalii]
MNAEGNWIFGLFLDGSQGPYLDGPDRSGPSPYIAYRTNRLHIGIDEIRYDLMSVDQLNVSAMLMPRFAPAYPDRALFDGLERDDTIEIGLTATYDFGASYTRLSVQADVAGIHAGYAAQVAYGYEAELGFAAVDVRASAELRDARLNNYLFGVAADEATDSRSAFAMGVMQVAGGARFTGQIPDWDRNHFKRSDWFFGNTAYAGDYPFDLVAVSAARVVQDGPRNALPALSALTENPQGPLCRRATVVCACSS